MKIRRLQVTMEPRTDLGVPRYVTVEVHTDCGKLFSTMASLDENHFQDVFGILMKDAEYRIRQLIKEKTTPADNKV